jgi:hypothetical protein
MHGHINLIQGKLGDPGTMEGGGGITLIMSNEYYRQLVKRG